MQHMLPLPKVTEKGSGSRATGPDYYPIGRIALHQQQLPISSSQLCQAVNISVPASKPQPLLRKWKEKNLASVRKGHGQDLNDNPLHALKSLP